MYEFSRGGVAVSSTTYVVIAEMDLTTHDIVKSARASGKKVFLVHDSLCFGCGTVGGCVAKYGGPIGCPNLLDDVSKESLAEGMYFVPFGSQWPGDLPSKGKTTLPSMFIDARKKWRGKPGAKDFVRIMQANFPNVSLAIYGDETIDMMGNAKHILYELKTAEFLAYMRKSWFFATGVPSDYGLSHADAAMAGAVLVDVGAVSKSAVLPKTALTICGHTPLRAQRCKSDRNFTSVADEVVEKLGGSQLGVIKAYLETKPMSDIMHAVDWKTSELAKETTDWFQRFHGPHYVGLNLLCSLHGEASADHVNWTASMYKSATPDFLKTQPTDAPDWAALRNPDYEHQWGSTPTEMNMLDDASESSCFGAATSLACRMRSTVAGWSTLSAWPSSESEAPAAFEACFNGGSADAELVPLSELRSGDRVVTLDASGAPTLDHVVLSQHTRDAQWAALLRLETANGAIVTVTPDHVVAVGGSFIAAADVTLGAPLSAGAVVRVTKLSGHVINPVTASGTLLVADTASRSNPIFASTHPEWIASFMLSAPTFPFVATHILSHLAPESLQDFYSIVEPAVGATLPLLQRACAAIPSGLLALGVVVADTLFALGVLLHGLGSIVRWLGLPLGIAGVACVTARVGHTTLRDASARDRKHNP
jgi:hypothetical protein